MRLSCHLVQTVCETMPYWHSDFSIVDPIQIEHYFFFDPNILPSSDIFHHPFSIILYNLKKVLVSLYFS